MCSTLCVGLGSLVMVGWFVKNQLLIQVVPSFAPMQFNTALGFCIFGLATILILLEKNMAAAAFAILGGLLGLFTLFQYLLGVSFGIDELFMEAHITVKTSNPGRMAPNTAFCFFLSGISTYLISRKVRLVRLVDMVSTLTFTLGVIAFEGYVVDIETTYGWANFTRMAVHSASGFVVLGLSQAILSWTLQRRRKKASNEKFKPWFVGYAISILFAILVVDIGIPLGVAAGTLYVPLVLFGWYISDIRSIVILALAATLFTGLGFLLSPSGSSLGVALANRTISVLAIWITAFQLYHNRRKKVALKYSEELRQAEERFRSVVEQAPNAIILVDKAGVISMVNGRTEELFGYERSTLIGSKQDVLIPNKTSGGTSKYFTSSFIDNMEGKNFTARRKDGTEIQIEISLNEIKIDDKDMTLATMVDVTAQKKQEELIGKQMSELQRKNNELEQLAYIASHDLQEPLRTVSNYLQVIKEDFETQLFPGMNQYLGRIGQAVERMATLVRALLDYSRLGLNQRLKETNCEKLVKEVISDLGSQIERTEALIQVEKLPTLLTYKTEFRQLFQNLISNALKFRKDDERCKIFIGCEKLEEHWKFFVKDNGIGIDPMNFDRVFQIFQQLHRNGKFTGNGIGLANCKKIADLHGGDIWVESKLKEGAIFHFTIANLEDHE